jgi:hypothetical protein
MVSSKLLDRFREIPHGEHEMPRTHVCTHKRVVHVATIALSFAFLIVSAQPVSADEGSFWMDYGDTVTGYIDSTKDTDFWYFSGSKGDVITILMHATSGNLDTYVDLWYRGSDWVWLAFDDNSGGSQTGNSLDAAIYSYELLNDGQYAIGAARTGKASGGSSGSYQLSLKLEKSATGSTSNYQSKGPVAYDFYEDSSCPAGMRCLTSGSFAWPTPSASYCVVPSSGGSFNNVGLWGDSNIRTYAANAAYYWRAKTGFNLYEVYGCSDSTNIVIGWASYLDNYPLGSTWVNQYVSNQQIVIALNYGSGGVVSDLDTGNILFHWNPTAGDGLGYDGSLVLAHEFGHAIGIGHDVQGGSGNLMYPNASQGATYSVNYPLGQDSINELLVKYPSLAVGGVNQYQKIGTSGAYLTSENGRQGYVQVPIPDGLENHLNDLRVGCTVVGYLPDGDDDVAFQCSWNISYASSGQVPFYLNTSYSDHSTVTAYALVWDANVYPQLDGITFRMDCSNIWVTDMANNTYQYSLPYTRYFNLPIYTSTPIVLINGYETYEEDTIGWSIRNNNNGSLTFFSNNCNSWENAYIQGHVQILGWTGTDSFRRTATGRSNSLGVNARADWNYYTICGNTTSQLADSGMVIWEPEASAFASLVEYWTGGDKDYGASNLLRAESGSGSNTRLRMEYLSEDGNSGSCVTWQNVLFQVGR